MKRKFLNSRAIPACSCLVALACLVMPAIAQVVPEPVPCPRGVDCYRHPCPSPCSGNKRCTSTQIACCCHPTGNPAPAVSVCSCKDPSACDNTSTPGQQCGT